MRKKNLKEHTTRVHGKNVHLKERHETSGQPKLSFGKRQKIILEVDLNNSTNLYTDEGETEDRKLAGKSGWHFSTKQTLFRSSGVVVNNIFKKKK